MRTSPFHPDRPFQSRHGLTLVEVLCATVLAGTLLAPLLFSQAAQLRQIRHAREAREAIVILDRALERWTSENGSLPRDGDHVIGESPDWFCRIARRRTPDARVFDAEVARVELRRRSGQGSEQPSASVEMLVPR